MIRKMFTSHNLLVFTFLSLTVVCSCSLALATSRDEADKTINTSINYLYLNYDEIHVRELQARQDLVLKNKYNQCGVLYTDAANALIQSIDFLESGDYQKLPPLASTALEKIQDCDKVFTPPGNETSFKNLNEKAIDVCANVLNVVKGLAPEKM